MKDFREFVLKTVGLRFRGADMKLDLSHALFSSNDVDAGSRLLLKAVAREADAASVGTLIDIGSGTGVLGIACALGYPGAVASFRDRDALACAFTERNARRNKVTPAAVEHALFLDGLGGREFDLVLCNVPAKAGPPVLDRFFLDLPRIVSPRGLGAVVVVNTIADAALASLRSALPGDGAVRLAERGAGHSVYLFGRGDCPAYEPPADPHAVYERTSVQRLFEPGRYRHAGYWGLPEFDTASYATDLAMELAELGITGALARRAAVVNPGSGRLPAFLRSRTNAAVDLCGRDALALAASARNLACNGSAQAPAVDGCLRVAWPDGLPGASYDLLAEYLDVTPRVDSFDACWSDASRILKSGACYLAVATSADFDRFDRKKPKGFSKLRERKKKGWAGAVWRWEP